MTTTLLARPETAAVSPEPQPSLASGECVAAWDLAKASLRMALAAQLPEAVAIHAGTAAASARLARSLSAQPAPPAA